MTVQLPQELESSLRAEVLNGHFASEDEAITEIVREYFHRKSERIEAVHPSENRDNPTDEKPIWELIDELRQGIPPEEFLKWPKDGAVQLDHYIYGSPKRPTA